MLVNSVLMIVISVFDNSEQRFDSILMMVNSVLKIVNLVQMTVFTDVKAFWLKSGGEKWSRKKITSFLSHLN